MTLRVTVEIVPYGDENHKKEIGRLHISNIGVVADTGLGHKICRYEILQLEENVPIDHCLYAKEILHSALQEDIHDP